MVLAFAEGSIQLVPDGTLLLHLVLIVIMVGLLNLTLLKPINQILEERERRTKGRLSEAQGVLVTVDAKSREHDSRLREARARGYAMLEAERATASLAREHAVAEIKSEVERWLDAEKRALQLAQEQVKGSLEREARGRALEIGSQILGRAVGPSQAP